MSELETQFQMETDVSGDNAIAVDDAMALLAMSESQLRKAISSSETLMAATVLTQDEGKVRVITESGTELITYGRCQYVPQRTSGGGIRKRGPGSEWLPRWEQTTY